MRHHGTIPFSISSFTPRFWNDTFVWSKDVLPDIVIFDYILFLAVYNNYDGFATPSHSGTNAFSPAPLRRCHHFLLLFEDSSVISYFFFCYSEVLLLHTQGDVEFRPFGRLYRLMQHPLIFFAVLRFLPFFFSPWEVIFFF